MSIDVEAGNIPPFELSDRLRRSLRHAGMGVQEMADYLGVSRNSVGNWINGHKEPGVAYVKLWALRTGVPYQWLAHGEQQSPRQGGPDGGVRTVRHQGLEPRTRWLVPA